VKTMNHAPATAQAAPAELTVDELRLVMMGADDVDEAYRVHDANRAFLAQFLDFAESYTYEKAVESYARIEGWIQSGDLVTYKILDGDEMVGNVNMTFMGNGLGRLGYWLAESAQGRGIATRASQALIDYGFNERGLDTVELLIKPENEPSQRVAERLRATCVGQVIEERMGADVLFDVWEVSRG